MLSLRQALSLNSSRVLGGDFSKFSCDFDGVDDCIGIANSADLRPTSALSISLWVKPHGWGVFLQQDGGNTNLRFRIRVSSTQTDCSGSNGYLTAELNDTITPTLSGWVHVVATYSAGVAKLKYNNLTTGVTNATGCSSATIHYFGAPLAVHIGADAANGGGGEAGTFLEGKIDDVAIFNTALSDADITSIYNNGKPNDISGMSGLIGYWQMGDPNGQASFPTIVDASSNSNDGTMLNMAAADIQTDVP